MLRMRNDLKGREFFAQRRIKSNDSSAFVGVHGHKVMIENIPCFVYRVYGVYHVVEPITGRTIASSDRAKDAILGARHIMATRGVSKYCRSVSWVLIKNISLNVKSGNREAVLVALDDLAGRLLQIIKDGE